MATTRGETAKEQIFFLGENFLRDDALSLIYGPFSVFGTAHNSTFPERRGGLDLTTEK